MRRDWTEARRKVDLEGRCRVCSARWPLQAAHLVGRRHDTGRVVLADDVVPLCPSCHEAYDGWRLDLLPYLTTREQAAMAQHVGLVRALRRATGGRSGDVPCVHPLR